MGEIVVFIDRKEFNSNNFSYCYLSRNAHKTYYRSLETTVEKEKITQISIIKSFMSTVVN